MTNSRSFTEACLEWLELPARDYAPWTAVSLQYGAGKVAAGYSHIRDIPTQIRGHWQHGWIAPHLAVDPAVVMDETVNNPSVEPCWVAREDQVEYLRVHGYRARAIGMPITYLQDRAYRRQQGSLLVMPAHSLEHTRHSWKFAEYANTIAGIRKEFNEVVICLHPACVKNCYWLNEFQDLGFPIIVGADANDRNSLERVKALMSQFEFVTTNSYGSLLAYGSAYGAKVSIYGPFCELKMEDHENTHFYQENPGILEKVLPQLSEHAVKLAYPHLFCSPIEAQENIAWGLQEIGYSNRLSPSEMKQCFGWTRLSGPIERVKRKAYFLGCCILPKNFKDALKETMSPTVKVRNQEIARLQDYPASTVGAANLDGEAFHFSDARTFHGSYRHIFQQNCYDFPCIKSDPRIIDCGANIGLAIRYWLKKYPKADILAFEPDPQLFAILKKNCEQSIEGRVTLRNEALWKETGMLEFRSTGIETGHLSEVAEMSPGETVSVKTVCLGDFLEHEVDFLKIDIEGAEVDVVLEAASKLFQVKTLCIEYHSFLGKEQRLGEMLEAIRKAGLRYHIVAEAFSEYPLLELKAEFGMDQRLIIWGFRGIQFPRTVEGPS